MKVGDLIVLKSNQRVPADCIFLHTSSESKQTYVRTDQLDGETDWKLRKPVQLVQRLVDEHLEGRSNLDAGTIHSCSRRQERIWNNCPRTSTTIPEEVDEVEDLAELLYRLRAVLRVENPHKDIYNFQGRFSLDSATKNLNRGQERNRVDHGAAASASDYVAAQSRTRTTAARGPEITTFGVVASIEDLQSSTAVQQEGLSLENTLWRDTVVTEGDVIAFVIYVGRETRVSLNLTKGKHRTGYVDDVADQWTFYCGVLMCLLAIVLATLSLHPNALRSWAFETGSLFAPSGASSGEQVLVPSTAHGEVSSASTVTVQPQRNFFTTPSASSRGTGSAGNAPTTTSADVAGHHGPTTTGVGDYIPGSRATTFAAALHLGEGGSPIEHDPALGELWDRLRRKKQAAIDAVANWPLQPPPVGAASAVLRPDQTETDENKVFRGAAGETTTVPST
ncbi:unnamed protein product, partial [Amoebophrya sp. A120]